MDEATSRGQAGQPASGARVRARSGIQGEYERTKVAGEEYGTHRAQAGRISCVRTDAYGRRHVAARSSDEQSHDMIEPP
jgi:hypothetical protein